MDQFRTAKRNQVGENAQSWLFSPGGSGGPIASTSYGWPWSFNYNTSLIVGPPSASPEKIPFTVRQQCGGCKQVSHGIIIDCVIPTDVEPKYQECVMSGRHYLLRQCENALSFPFADQNQSNNLACRWTEVACVPQWKWDRHLVKPVLWGTRPIVDSRRVTMTGYDDQFSPANATLLDLWGPRICFDLGFNQNIIRTRDDGHGGSIQDNVFPNQWTITSRGLHLYSDLNPITYPVFSNQDTYGRYVWQLTNSVVPYTTAGISDTIPASIFSYSCCGTNVWGEGQTATALASFTNKQVFPDPTIVGFPYGCAGNPSSQRQVLSSKAAHQ